MAKVPIHLQEPPDSMPLADRHYLSHLVKNLKIILTTFNNKVGIFGRVTLVINVGTTTVTNTAILSTDTIILSPTNADAANEISLGTSYATAANGHFTIVHDNNATADRTFNYIVLR